MMRHKTTMISLLLALLLGLLCLGGCSGAGNQNTTAAPTVPATTPVATAPATTPAATTAAPVTTAATTVPTETTAQTDLWEQVFETWNPQAPALNTLIDFVESVTDEASPDYIPVDRRVAVFDMDGTLYAELFPTYLEYYMLAWRILADPDFEPDEEMIAVAEEIRRDGINHSYAGDMMLRHGTQAARAYAGMTLTEFAHYVTTLLLKEADGFTGMTYGEAYYQPMVEVVEYLQDNDFAVYVVSGSDRYICRTLFEGIIDIPFENFIGMDVQLKASGQGDTDGLDYQYSATDQLLRSDELLVKNLKMNKVTAIAREIGKQPVLSFGNTSGDSSMHMYTITDNPYRSLAFMLIADDDVRDYGNPEKGETLRQQWEEKGFHVISMRDDFLTIYGEGVQKTGSFRWMQELGGK